MPEHFKARLRELGMSEAEIALWEGAWNEAVPGEAEAARTLRQRREKDAERKRAQRKNQNRLPEGQWLPLVGEILRRDDYTCAYCGVRALPKHYTQKAKYERDLICVDHVVPLCRGGTNDKSNLVAACIVCNSSKAGKLLEEWTGSPIMSSDDLRMSADWSSDRGQKWLKTGVNSKLLSADRQKPALHIVVNKEIKKENKRAKKSQIPMSEDWTPSDQAVNKLLSEGFDNPQIARAVERMRNHFIAKGGKSTNWDLNLYNWMDRQKEWGNGKANGTDLQLTDEERYERAREAFRSGTRL